MKRTLSFALTIFLLLGCLCGCSAQEQPPVVPPTPETPSGIQYESPEQEAVVKTALAFLARGNRIQYDDTRFSSDSMPIEYRWQHGIKSPEDYTTQFLGYSNCAAFTYDVFMEALDYDILCYTTQSLTEKGAPERVYKYWPTGSETDEEKAAVEANFRSKLKMGDLIVIRYNGSRHGNGHAMLYVGSEVLEGNDGYRGTAAENTNEDDNATDKLSYDIIHSTGSSYSYGNYTEKFEEHGTVQITSTDSLFDPATGRYVFGKLDSIAIIRPLNAYKGGVPQKTQNRIKNLYGVVAEKLCSHTYGMTVAPGGLMTFTFSITNKNDAPVTLDIKDTVPANTTYVSGAETVQNGNLSWKLTVPAKSTGSVSYTVKVNGDAPLGGIVYSDNGTVGGVDVDCPKVYIENTLNAEEQARLVTTAQSLASSGLRGPSLANTNYKEILGSEELFPEDFATLMDAIYTPYGLTQNILNDEGGYLGMIAPGLFGGRYVSPRVDAEDADRLESIRTRLPYARDLMVGDIIIACDNADLTVTEAHRLYLVCGETVLDLISGEEADTAALANKLLAYNRFAVLRPSITE